MKRYSIVHETKYTYGQPVEHGLHVARISPVGTASQRLLEHDLFVSPHPTWAASFTDHFGNAMHHISLEDPHSELVVKQCTTIEVAPQAWLGLRAGATWESVRDATLEADSFPDLPQVDEFIYASPLAPLSAAATAYARESFKPGMTVVDAAFDLATRIKADFRYSPGSTTVTTSVAEVMNARHGVCQDFAHAMISGIRGLGLPARYVSGYLKTQARPMSGQEFQAAPALVGADATHAWVSVWCGAELGWIEFDPTNALMVADEHIVLAYGRDFSDVTPLRGVIVGGGSHTFAVSVSVELIGCDAPRP